MLLEKWERILEAHGLGEENEAVEERYEDDSDDEIIDQIHHLMREGLIQGETHNRLANELTKYIDLDVRTIERLMKGEGY